MPRLAVNIDHVATIRQARQTFEPDPIAAAAIAVMAGAEGIIVHLREDRRHIQDRDLRLLRQTVYAKLNMEMATTDEMIGIALDVKPDMVTLVPESRQELTTEGGLEIANRKDEVGTAVERLKAGGVRVSLFIDPEAAQVQASKDVGADIIEIHTGQFAESWLEDDPDKEFARVVAAAKEAHALGLEVSAGHGLTYQNIVNFPTVKEITEYSIGHSIISRAVMTGLDRAVRDMITLIKGASR